MKNLNIDLAKKHILESVLNDEGENFTNLDDLKEYVKSEFNRVANYEYNLKRYPNKFNRFSDYLNSVPFNFEIYYNEIEKIMLELYPTRQKQIKRFTTDTLNYYYHKLIYDIIMND